MRLRAIAFALVAVAGVAAAALWLGRTAAAYVERTTLALVSEGLAAAGEGWAEAATDGLIVTLTGEAPDEGSRLRAVEIVKRIVDPRRVRDVTGLAAAAAPGPAPPFAIEAIRDGTEVSLIGLAPEASGRAAVRAALDAAGFAGTVADMLETVDHAAPAGWDAALAFGLAALAELPRAKVSIAPGEVSASALAASEAERAALEARLEAARPAGVTLALAVTTPRPTISPFRLDFALTADGGARLDVCAAESAADAAAVAAAAGLPAADCALGVGAPSPDWAAAAAAGIAAVRAMGGGRFTMRDVDAELAPPEGAAAAQVAAATAALKRELPGVFSLRAPEPVAESETAEAADDAAGAGPWFDAVLAADGAVRLSGTVADAASRDAIVAVAAALFGHERVADATVLAAPLPEGWPARVLAGVEALALMKEGRLEVTPERVSVEGAAAAADGRARAEALLAAKAPGATRLAVRFDPVAAATEAKARALVDDPAGACRDAVAASLERQAIVFEPGAEALGEAGAAAVAAVARVLTDCPPLDFEIAGHTDSAGAPERNQALSEARAAAVKAALEASDLPHMRFAARGYGAALPVADNATEEGRAANRRIEFRLAAPASEAASATGEARVGPR
jgi:OOP family OmpA-OmpF porin